MNYYKLTLQDCIEMFERQSITVLINDGSVIGFHKEKDHGSD